VTRALLRSSLVALWLPLALACASRIRSEVAVKPDTDLSRYHTFALLDAVHPPAGTPAAANHDLAERLVAERLIAQGLSPAADPRQADLLVEVVMGRRAQARLSGSSTGGGTAAGLMVTMSERTTGKVVFRGLAHETWSASMDPQTEIRKAVDSIAQEVAKQRR
jgi:hypothetical protein